MARRYIVLGSIAILGVLFLFGCSGEKKQVDPYAEVSLEQATRGPVVVSKGFKYKLRNPEIVEGNGGGANIFTCVSLRFVRVL